MIRVIYKRLQKISWTELLVFTFVSAVSAFAWALFMLTCLVVATLLFFQPDSFGNNTTYMFTKITPYFLGIGFLIPGVIVFLWSKAVKKNPFLYLSIFYLTCFIEIFLIVLFHKSI